MNGLARDRIEQLSAETEEAHFLLLLVQYNERFEGKFADFLQRETRYELWKDGHRYFADPFGPPRREGCYYRLLCCPEEPSELPSGEVLQESGASEIFHRRSERPLLPFTFTETGRRLPHTLSGFDRPPHHCLLASCFRHRSFCDSEPG